MFKKNHKLYVGFFYHFLFKAMLHV